MRKKKATCVQCMVRMNWDMIQVGRCILYCRMHVVQYMGLNIMDLRYTYNTIGAIRCVGPHKMDLDEINLTEWHIRVADAMPLN